MFKTKAKLLILALTTAGLCCFAPARALETAAAPAAASLKAAPHLNAPQKAPIMAATLAGKRVVAVGDYGVVILSDDGKSYRQARQVPTRAVLTSVWFIDDKNGWVSGHDGTILGTTDGGETWQLLREEPGKERVLMSIWFENAQHGLAVGQFGLALETDDAGKTWRERHLVEAGEQADKHMMDIFPASNGLVFVAAESGSIFRSEDGGRHWKVVQTDNKGSFWTGKMMADGSLVAAGMRGHVYRSDDKGLSWQEIASGTQQSITEIIQHEGGVIALVGNSGVVLSSTNSGRSFAVSLRPDRANLTAAVAAAHGDALFSLSGVVEAGTAGAAK